MTRKLGEIALHFWLLPFWLAAMYQFGSYLYHLGAAQRDEHRTGIKPFILWRDECLTREGQGLRRRGTRAVGRFITIIVTAVLIGLLLQTLGLR
jgi:hypothetical protein